MGQITKSIDASGRFDTFEYDKAGSRGDCINNKILD